MKSVIFPRRKNASVLGQFKMIKNIQFTHIRIIFFNYYRHREAGSRPGLTSRVEKRWCKRTLSMEG